MPEPGVQLLTAHAVLRDGDAVLLDGARPQGGLQLPGGEVRHGEHPRAAVTRLLAQCSGAPFEVLGLRDVVTDVAGRPGHRVHTLRVVYDAVVAPSGSGPVSGTLRPIAPERLAGLELAPFTARLLGLRTADGPAVPELPAAGAGEHHPAPGGQVGDAGDRPVPFRRAGAYAVVVDAGRILLSRFVGSGEWSLPGGGIDHGEDPRAAVRREVYEETGLELLGAELVDVDSVHFVGHAPDGRLEDFHGVRVVYTGAVGPGEPRVVEVDGTTDASAWFRLEELPELRLTGLALHATAHLR